MTRSGWSGFYVGTYSYRNHHQLPETLMANSLVVKAARLIGAGDISGAEFALVSLVDTEGDHALVEVLEELPPKDGGLQLILFSRPVEVSNLLI